MDSCTCVTVLMYIHVHFLVQSATGAEEDVMKWHSLEEADYVSGACSPQLVLHSIQKGNSGRYRCVVWNIAGEVESNPVTLNVISHGKA